MKLRVSRNELKKAGYTIISVPYCALSNLLWYFNPTAYNYGTYGWNYDVYFIGNNVALTTGYRPIGRSANNYRTYDSKAAEILSENLPHEETLQRLSILLADFAKQA